MKKTNDELLEENKLLKEEIVCLTNQTKELRLLAEKAGSELAIVKHELIKLKDE